jgi:hypothetical protein
MQKVLTDAQVSEIAKGYLAGRNTDGIPPWELLDFAKDVIRGMLELPVIKQAFEDVDREEDEFIIKRLTELMAGVCVALKGDEEPLHRHSYHDIVEVAQALKLELELYRSGNADVNAHKNEERIKGSDKLPFDVVLANGTVKAGCTFDALIAMIDASKKALELPTIAQALEDSKRLDWIIDNEAKIIASSDVEYSVWIGAYSEDGSFNSPRDAIDEARKDGKS